MGYVFKSRGYQLAGLYKFLDAANTDFIKKSEEIDAESGPGSDSNFSDYSYSREARYSKKIVVSSGMMAINLAYNLGRWTLKKNKNLEEHTVNLKTMYYETHGCIYNSLVKRHHKVDGKRKTVNKI